MRHLIHLIWLPLLLLALSLATLYYLAFTQSGLAVLATELNGRIGPVDIRVRGARGTLAGGVHVDLLVIDHRRAHIEIENASGRLAILPLAWQTIRVPEAHAERLLIHALPRSGESHDWTPHFLPALMRIEADHVDAQRWRLITTNGTALDSTAISAAGTVYPKTIRIYAGALEYNGVHVKASGEVRAAASIGLAGELHFDAQPQGQPAWTVDAHIDGNLARLGLSADISEPFAADFRGEVLDLTGNWRWQGRSKLRRFDVSAWHAGNALGLITGALQVQGDRAGFRAAGALDPAGLHAGPLETEFAGRFSDRVLSISRLRLRHAGSGAEALARGTVTIVSAGPRLDLHGEWSHFRWPLAKADAAVYSERGSYSLAGTRPFALAAQGALRAAALNSSQVTLRGRLGTDALSADSATLEAYGAQALLTGEVRWASPRGWQLQGQIRGLDVALLRPGIQGRLNFALRAAGHSFDAQGDLDANISALSGAIRGQPAQGHAHLAHGGDGWRFDDVRLQLGATRIEADGRLGAKLDLNFAIDADDLGLLQAGARGRLQARGSVRGDWHDPTLLASAKAHDLGWNAVRLETLDAAVTFDPHGSGRADCTVLLQGLQISDRRLERLTLRTQGTASQHSLALDARSGNLRFAARGSGQYAAGAWQADVASADFGDGANLRMSLESPAHLRLAADRLYMEESCLRGQKARLCASVALEATQRRLVLSATSLPMSALTAGLTAATDYAGTLTVKLEASAPRDQPWRGAISAQLEDAAIHKHFENGRVETLRLGNGVVDAALGEREFSCSLALDAGAAGRVDGSFAAHGADDVWRDWPLTGQLRLETDALGFIDSYVSQIDRASGRLTAALALSGTAAAPQLSGQLKVADAQLDAYQINLSLRELNFSAQLADNTLMLEGSANAGPDGHASVNGKLRWLHGLPYGELHLLGSDLRVLNIPEARVDASPDVTLHMEAGRIDVSGQVSLPYARIEPADLANAVLPSGDEMIIGEDVSMRESAFKVYSDLTLVLGERVTVNTQGLSGRLSGSLTVTTDDTGINRGSGELKVEEGKYLAYGRKLDIERGRLLFSNGLLGDPGLDLRAVKAFPDIKAGVNVRGTLRHPRMTFFSDPEVSQSQIVSLLLAGGSLESVQNTSADPNGRGNAARSDLLMQGGAILAQQIGGRFDVEAGVEQDLSNETSLVLGRYLSPRLYLSYGIGLAEAINTIKMRYTIGDHWTIKTEAGTQRSADLVFTIEK